jgi:hypothetical protein
MARRAHVPVGEITKNGQPEQENRSDQERAERGEGVSSGACLESAEGSPRGIRFFCQGCQFPDG